MDEQHIDPLFDDESSEYGRPETGAWDIDEEPNFDERCRWQEPTPGLQMFTFGLVYKHGEDEYVEEIDVWARERYVAERRATLIARHDYEPGYDRMVELPAGGSAGTFTVISL